MVTLEPVIITQEQGIWGRSEACTGEKALLAAVLQSAVDDLTRPCDTTAEHNLFDVALSWVNEGDVGLFSFLLCCKSLGFDPDYIRAGLRQRIQAAASPVEFSFGDDWRAVYGKWGKRFMVDLTGRVFDRKRKEHLVPITKKDGGFCVLLRGSHGAWKVLLGRIMARTWGGAGPSVKVDHLDGDLQNCSFTNLTWDTKRHGGTPGVICLDEQKSTE